VEAAGEGTSSMATTSVPGPVPNRWDGAIAAIFGPIAFCGALATGLTAWTVARSPILTTPGTDAAWRAVLVAAFVIAGTVMVSRRLDNRMGWLVLAFGFAVAAIALDASGDALVYTLGIVVWVAVNVVFAAYAILCFPRGRLESAPERVFMAGVVLVNVILIGLILALSPKLPTGGPLAVCGHRCPGNALQLAGNAGIGGALLTAFGLASLMRTIGMAMLVFSKARSPLNLRRRLIMPLAVVFIFNALVFVSSMFLLPGYPAATEPLRIAYGVSSLAIPFAFVAGQLRGDVFAVSRLGRIAVGARDEPMTPADVERVIGEAVGDRSLRLALWAPDEGGYVSVDGAPIELPETTSARAVTRIGRDSGSLAALIHDPTLDTESGVVEGLAATSLMLLENARLVDELRASRSRLVQTAEHERRRLERDLHDGAQQRLMAIQIQLTLAQEEAAGSSLARRLASIADEAAETVQELRTLAHGIYPPVLADRGLAEALRSVALSAPIPVAIDSDQITRLPSAVEAVIYYCAREAIQNAIKHAGDGAAVTVRLGRAAAGVAFEIADDGVGIGDPGASDGVGLTNMRDRVGAIGGDLEVRARPGGGTIVRATIPVDEPAGSPGAIADSGA
jgi:signal transduction histidine kinase